MNEINSDLVSISISKLSYDARKLLSCLLNPIKVLPSDGVYMLPRNWEGLASRINILTTEEASNIKQTVSDCTARILELWISKYGDDATFGCLMQYLSDIDRFDVFDDLLDLAKKGQLMGVGCHHDTSEINLVVTQDNDDLITFDDKQYGFPQKYNAFVLYAPVDQDFVTEMIERMKLKNLKLCTPEDLLPNHTTQHEPISRLISHRCNYIILIYSPEFLESPANKFYMDYAQAVGIENRLNNIVPCVYRDVGNNFPRSVQYYHKLYYNRHAINGTTRRPVYDFWERLASVISVAPRVQLPEGELVKELIHEIAGASPRYQEALLPATRLPAIKGAISRNTLGNSVSSSLPCLSSESKKKSRFKIGSPFKMKMFTKKKKPKEIEVVS